jgi:uracil-DNA glycosylase
MSTANAAPALGMPDETPTPEATTGLQLDPRQRAMLQAMGIQLWEPDFYKPKQPSAQQSIARAAIKSAAPIAEQGATAARDATPTPMPPRSPAPVPSTPPVQRASAPTAAPARAATPAPAANTSPLPLPDGIERMDWLQLQSAVSTCQACSLCASRKNTVFGTGQPNAEPALPPRADWLIVGEAPGENEDIQGEPFVGQAGKLLDNMLRAMVVNGQPLARQSNVFIANVLKCRPPANRNPSAEEVAMCQPYLLRQIALLQPKIILAMGRFAVQALTGSTEPLGKLRGRVHALQSGTYQAPVIVTYHPAYLLRNLPDKAKAWADLLLAMETLSSGG